MAIIVLRGLLGTDEGLSVIQGIKAFQQVGIESKIFRFRLEPDEIFESAILGHSHLILDQGPLTIAALGFYPPDDSLQFHVSLVSTDDDQVTLKVPAPSAQEFAVIEKLLLRLNTKNLSVVIGEGLDHGLVREKPLEIRTFKPTEAAKFGVRKSLPEGDGENEIRRFIDDSVNLLADEEFNLRRIDNGVAPINLCWPWGQGLRQLIPNRVLELGQPWKVRARMLSLRGLARLSGFQVEKLEEFPMGSFRKLRLLIQNERRTLTVLDLGSVPTDEERREAFQFRLLELGEQLVDPLLEWRRESTEPLCFVASNGSNEGVVAVWAKANERDNFPFDERSLTEKRVPFLNLRALFKIE